jgi:hypothetical protein
MGDFLIATDMDRTLLPNGNQEYDGSMDIFKKVLKENSFKLAYVTGRNLELVKDAMKQYDTPEPDYVIGDVGTRIYEKRGTRYKQDEGWARQIGKKTKNWDVRAFRESLTGIASLREQEPEKQNEYKQSYYMDDLSDWVHVIKRVIKRVKGCSEDAIVVSSVDETHNIGLIDILPKYATKLTALEHVRNKLDYSLNQVVYCGDSGNDIMPLTYGYRSVLVRNAIDAVRHTVRHESIEQNTIDRLHIIKSDMGGLNGYYVSGIIQGLIKFKIIDSSYAKNA